MIYLNALWNFILTSAPYMLLGLLAAGVIKQFVPMEKIKKWLGGQNLASVFRASLLGVPLPLCSCAVIPTAVTLRKSGASKAATSSFLISTPESGVDSIAITYALMDFPMMLIRPIAAFSSAFFAGLMQILFNKEDDMTFEQETPKSCCPKSGIQKSDISFSQRVKESFRFGYTDLINDIALWFGLGLVLGAGIDVFVPSDFFSLFGVEGSRFLILLIGIPVYICASATTPIAVALVMKGISPGAALLLLLVGPATNLSNILVLQKYIGRKAIFLNIFSIAFVALAFSYAVDYFYTTGVQWHSSHDLHDHGQFSFTEQILGVLLVLLILKGIYIEQIRPFFKKKAHQHDHGGSDCH